MAKLEKLTEDQEFLMAEVKEEWIKRALLEGDSLDDKQARKSLEWLYSFVGKKKPITVLLDSPLALQYAANMLNGIDGDQVRGQVWDQVWDQVGDQVRGQVRGQVGGQVGDQVRGQVRGQVWDQVGDQVWDQVRGQVGGQVGGQVWDQVGGQVWDQVWDQVWGQVWDQVWGQVWDKKLTSYSFAYEDLAFSSGWVAFYDYFERLGIVKHKAFKEYVKLLKSGIFMTILFENVALACRRPVATRRDEQTRLHSDQKPAIEWRDGYKLYYLHGQVFQEDLWQRITGQKMTIKDIMKIDNADERTMAISMLRPDRLLKHMNAHLINTGRRGTKLYEVKNFMDTKDTEYCMHMIDPSTDRDFIEWVEPSVGIQADADLAQATAWGIPLEDYLNLGQEA